MKSMRCLIIFLLLCLKTTYFGALCAVSAFARHPSELMKNIFRSVLDIDWKSENYQKLYRQRKSLISELKKPLPETIDFCKILSTKGEDEIYYLTDLTQPEKEKIIKWLSNYGVKYSKD